MATTTTHRKNSERRPIIALQSDKDCYDELVIDGFVMPPIDKTLEEALDLLEELSERYRQFRDENKDSNEALIDFVIRQGFTEVEDGGAGWFIFRDRD
jgi:hypothetical protein